MSYAGIKEFLNQFLIDHGISSDFSALISFSLLLIIHLILGGIIFWVTRKLILKIAHSIAEKTKSQFDDLLTQNKFPKRVSYLVPLFYFHSVIPNLFESNEVIYGAIENIVELKNIYGEKYITDTQLRLAYKGLEYDNVIVLMENAFGREKKYFSNWWWCKKHIFNGVYKTTYAMSNYISHRANN